jgi:hypothetical protein
MEYRTQLALQNYEQALQNELANETANQVHLQDVEVRNVPVQRGPYDVPVPVYNTPTRNFNDSRFPRRILARRLVPEYWAQNIHAYAYQGQALHVDNAQPEVREWLEAGAPHWPPPLIHPRPSEARINHSENNHSENSLDNSLGVEELNFPLPAVLDQMLSMTYEAALTDGGAGTTLASAELVTISHFPANEEISRYRM